MVRYPPLSTFRQSFLSISSDLTKKKEGFTHTVHTHSDFCVGWVGRQASRNFPQLVKAYHLELFLI